MRSDIGEFDFENGAPIRPGNARGNHSYLERDFFRLDVVAPLCSSKSCGHRLVVFGIQKRIGREPGNSQHQHCDYCDLATNHVAMLTTSALTMHAEILIQPLSH